jgi:hypothetical protein
MATVTMTPSFERISLGHTRSRRGSTRIVKQAVAAVAAAAVTAVAKISSKREPW